MVEEIHRLRMKVEFPFVSKKFEVELMPQGRFAFDVFNNINYINN
jgi:hypothetical protein